MANVKNVALLDDQNRLVNHIILDIDNEDDVQALLEYWGATRFVETKDDHDIIVTEDPNVWSVWDDETEKFTITGIETERKIVFDLDREVQTVKINGVDYPVDSHVFIENAEDRPEGWTGTEYRLSDYL